MRVLVTGATGFIGRHVVEKLLQRGHVVTVLAREESLLQEGPSPSAVRGDLLRPESYFSALEKNRPDGCIHLGWYANPKDYLTHRVNVDLVGASVALGEKLAALGCTRFVGVGTCIEYDTSNPYLSEATTPLHARTLYAACKRATCEMLDFLTRGSSLELAWARPFFLYGPHENPERLVPTVIHSLLSGGKARVSSGEQIRDFMHIEDCAEALVHVLETSGLVGPVNIASGVPVTVREVVKKVARQLNAEDRVLWGAATPRASDPAPFICANVTKLYTSGFRPRYDLESGLRNTIAWHQEKARGAQDARLGHG